MSVLVMEMVPYDFAEFVTQMFLWPADENDLSALLLVIGHCLRSSLGTTELTETRFALSKVRLLPGVRAWPENWEDVRCLEARS